MALAFPIVQGVAHDHSSLDVKLDGISYVGLKTIDWNDALTPGKVFGTSAQKIAETRGQYDGDMSFELYKEYGKQFEKSLIAAHKGTGLYEIRFPVDVIIAPEGGSDQTEANIVGVKINKRSVSSSSGSEAITYKYECSVMSIILDGVEPITGLHK
jgi:hypothetical protein